jgi:hypothetical protein
MSSDFSKSEVDQIYLFYGVISFGSDITGFIDKFPLSSTFRVKGL